MVIVILRQAVLSREKRFLFTRENVWWGTNTKVGVKILIFSQPELGTVRDTLVASEHVLTKARTVAELHSRVDFYEEANDAISLDSEEEELLYLKGRMRAQQAAQQCRVNNFIFCMLS